MDEKKEQHLEVSTAWRFGPLWLVMPPACMAVAFPAVLPTLYVGAQEMVEFIQASFAGYGKIEQAKVRVSLQSSPRLLGI